MEWSLDVESILFVKLSLGGFTLPLINVDNIPLLMDLSTLCFITLNVSSFRISFSLDIKVFTSFISDVSTFSSEQLPPSGVLCCCRSNIWMSSISMDFHYVVSPVNVENELGLLIESPLRVLGMVWSPSSEIDPVVSVHCDKSLHWHS